MSPDFTLTSEFSREKLYGLTKQQKQQSQETEQQQSVVKQDPSSSGIQWAQVQSAQASEQVNNTQKPGSQNVQSKGPEIALPNLDDVAMLSSAVSTKVQEVTAESIGRKIFSKAGINIGALKEKFKEYFKKSKSHNLLLERFMANVKMSGLNALMSLAGLSSSNIEKIKSEVRQEAIAEIDSKISQDWAYAKAMIEVMG